MATDDTAARHDPSPTAQRNSRHSTTTTRISRTPISVQYKGPGRPPATTRIQTTAGFVKTFTQMTAFSPRQSRTPAIQAAASSMTTVRTSSSRKTLPRLATMANHTTD